MNGGAVEMAAIYINEDGRGGCGVGRVKKGLPISKARPFLP